MSEPDTLVQCSCGALTTMARLGTHECRTQDEHEDTLKDIRDLLRAIRDEVHEWHNRR